MTDLTVARARDKSISSIKVIDAAMDIRFDDGTGISIFDDGQCCCESRYMVCDDDLDAFIGARFVGFEIRDVAMDDDDAMYDHEIQFLEVQTTRGVISVASHNEHNGYYGGFNIRVGSLD